MRRGNRIVQILIAVVILLLIVLFGLILATRDALFADIREFFLDKEVITDTSDDMSASNTNEDYDAPELDDFLNGRDPETFTWEEYQALTPDQQSQFADYFESMDAFDQWYDATKREEQETHDVPELDDFLNGRDPETMTWEEYQALTPEQQAQLPDYFESLDAFERWYNSVKVTEHNNDDSGNVPETSTPAETIEETDAPELDDFLNGRDPESFTWEEYQALTQDQQAQFPDYFTSMDAFERWYEAAKDTAQGGADDSDAAIDATTNGETMDESDVAEQGAFLNGRDPESFTWEEYQALTQDQQAMFPDYFESYDAFLRWKSKNEP